MEPLTKPEANVIAPAALAGVTVTPTEDDTGKRVYCVSRWSLTKQRDSLAEVVALLSRMGIKVSA